MDANKLQVLNDIGYKIRETCGTCRDFQVFTKSDFGTCSYHEYKHLKHTGEPRQLSVHQHGYCPWWRPNEQVRVSLGRFAELCE